jgi:hypothetical protein
MMMPFFRNAVAVSQHLLFLEQCAKIIPFAREDISSSTKRWQRLKIRAEMLKK